jgi:hypothetical protein
MNKVSNATALTTATAKASKLEDDAVTNVHRRELGERWIEGILRQSRSNTSRKRRTRDGDRW